VKKITVFLSDDHAIFREGLRLLLETADDIEVVGEADNGSRAVGEAKRLRPDVVLMDLAMPLLNGVEAARRISREVPGVKVLILSSFNDDLHVRHAIEAGAAGYLMKETASRDLLRAIRETSKGNAFFSPLIARRLSKQWRNRDLQSETSAHGLTGRQTEILQLIAEGHSSKQMAALLSISVKTVEKHRQALMDKLDIHEIATLTRYAVSTGIVDSNRSPLNETVFRQHASRLSGRELPTMAAAT
jgi:DNA-binding NarL/FixJ family response regulator